MLLIPSYPKDLRTLLVYHFRALGGMYASFLTFAIPHNEGCKVRVRILLALGCPKSSSSQPKLSPSPFSSGIAPALVVPPLLQRFGLTVDDIAFWELNEGESISNL